MLTIVTFGAVLAALVLQPLVLRRWPTLDRYGLPPSTRHRAREPLPWEIPLPATPPEETAAPTAQTPTSDAEYRQWAALGHASRGIDLREIRTRHRQAAFDHRYQQARALQQQFARDEAALSQYVRDQTHQYAQQMQQAAGLAQYHAACYTEPTTSAPAGSVFNPTRNCYQFIGGRVEIDAAYWTALTSAQRAALVPPDQT